MDHGSIQSSTVSTLHESYHIIPSFVAPDRWILRSSRAPGLQRKPGGNPDSDRCHESAEKGQVAALMAMSEQPSSMSKSGLV